MACSGTALLFNVIFNDSFCFFSVLYVELLIRQFMQHTAIKNKLNSVELLTLVGLVENILFIKTSHHSDDGDTKHL
jgi:hypothetical protein